MTGEEKGSTVVVALVFVYVDVGVAAAGVAVVIVGVVAAVGDTVPVVLVPPLDVSVAVGPVVVAAELVEALLVDLCAVVVRGSRFEAWHSLAAEESVMVVGAPRVVVVALVGILVAP